MTELVNQGLERHTVLQSQGRQGRERVHQAGDSTALLRHDQEDLPRRTILEHPHGDVSFMPSNRKLVRDSRALIRQAPPQRALVRANARMRTAGCAPPLVGIWWCQQIPSNARALVALRSSIEGLGAL